MSLTCSAPSTKRPQGCAHSQQVSVSVVQLGLQCTRDDDEGAAGCIPLDIVDLGTKASRVRNDRIAIPLEGGTMSGV